MLSKLLEEIYSEGTLRPVTAAQIKENDSLVLHIFNDNTVANKRLQVVDSVSPENLPGLPELLFQNPTVHVSDEFIPDGLYACLSNSPKQVITCVGGTHSAFFMVDVTDRFDLVLNNVSYSNKTFNEVVVLLAAKNVELTGMKYGEYDAPESMSPEEAQFQQDPLVIELRNKGIVKQSDDEELDPIGFVILNHSRNENIRIELKPARHRPELLTGHLNQNPTAFVDDDRGELRMCLTHADKFVISCAGAPSSFMFATSFGQMIVDLYRNSPNIEIIINSVIYTPDDFIRTVTGTRRFDSAFMTDSGLSYVDILGSYKLQVSGIRTVRFEVRVHSPGNGMTVSQVQSLFGQAQSGDNPTAVYHSNSDFYGFTLCMESTSIPSITKIEYATVETMDTLIQEGIITSYNNDAKALQIAATDPGVESALSAGFSARLLNEFEETPIRKQDYLLVLESDNVDLSTIDLTKINAKYDVYESSTTPAALMMVLSSFIPPAGDRLVSQNNIIDARHLYRIGNKIVYPMTMSENDNNQYLVFDIDFDGAGSSFIEANHKLDIKITKDPDVTIPLLVDYPTDTPQDIAQLSFAVFDRHQYYQFAVNVAEDSILYVETQNISATNAEITIANHVTGEDVPVALSNPNLITGAAKGWYFENQAFVVIQMKVPIGVTGKVYLGQSTVSKPLLGYTQTENGTLVVDSTTPSMHILTRAGQNKLLFGNPGLYNKPVLQLYNVLVKGQAVAMYQNQGVYFAQGVSEIRDWKAIDGWEHLRGTTGAWAYIAATSNVSYATQTKPAVTTVTLPNAQTSANDKYVVYEFVTGGIRMHYYQLDSNFVPITYFGNTLVPWTYDETKPISILAVPGPTAIGTPYNVAPGDLGPLRTDFKLSHNYEVVVTDVTEV